MLFKKIKMILISVGLLIILSAGLNQIIHNKFSIPSFKTRPAVEYRMDQTKIKIQSILAKNKLQSLEITFSAAKTFDIYDKAKINYFESLKKTLTMRHLTIEGNYKALFSYDLSKAGFCDNNDGTYTITLHSEDIELNIVDLNKDTKATLSILGDNVNDQSTNEAMEKLRQIVYEKMNTKDNIGTTLKNTKFDLVDLLSKVGVNMDKVRIEIF